MIITRSEDDGGLEVRKERIAEGVAREDD